VDHVRNAREHNLKASMCRSARCLHVITGSSGSGKSTLRSTYLFTEGRGAHNSLKRMHIDRAAGRPPDVDSIYGIPPTVAIESAVSRGGRKSTVSPRRREVPHFPSITCSSSSFYITSLTLRLAGHPPVVRRIVAQDRIACAAAHRRAGPAIILARVLTCWPSGPPTLVHRISFGRTPCRLRRGHDLDRFPTYDRAAAGDLVSARRARRQLREAGR